MTDLVILFTLHGPCFLILWLCDHLKKPNLIANSRNGSRLRRIYTVSKTYLIGCLEISSFILKQQRIYFSLTKSCLDNSQKIHENVKQKSLSYLRYENNFKPVTYYSLEDPPAWCLLIFMRLKICKINLLLRISFSWKNKQTLSDDEEIVKGFCELCDINYS